MTYDYNLLIWIFSLNIWFKIVLRTEAGRVIQEGDDDIHSNVETVDHKDTYYSMVMVVFQEQVSGYQVESAKVGRSTQKLSWFVKPNQCTEPNKFENPMRSIFSKIGQIGIMCHTFWMLLQLLQRNIIPVQVRVPYADSLQHMHQLLKHPHLRCPLDIPHCKMAKHLQKGVVKITPSTHLINNCMIKHNKYDIVTQKNSQTLDSG